MIVLETYSMNVALVADQELLKALVIVMETYLTLVEYVVETIHLVLVVQI